MGEIEIKSSDISYLFNRYKKNFIKVFQVSESMFLKIKNLKTSRGGILIEILKDNNPLGLFTLSNAEENFFELGDIIRIKFKFPRKTFSQALRIGCEKAIEYFYKKGIYGYPNHLAIDFLLLAGFKTFRLYQKKIYFVFLKVKFELPFNIYNYKKHFRFNYFYKFPLSFIKFKLKPTGSKYLKLTIYKKTNIKEFNYFNYFGFIYEFVLSKENGDPFIIFGSEKFPNNKIDFQFTDNSA